MAIVRKRAMTPSVMSMATLIAVPCAAAAMASMRTPGTTYSRYSARPPVGAPAAWPSPAPRIPPKTKTNSSRKTIGIPTRISVMDG